MSLECCRARDFLSITNLKDHSRVWTMKLLHGKQFTNPVHSLKLCKKCPYSEFFCSVFSCIRTEYGDLLCKCPYSVRMLENMDQKNLQFRHFLRSVTHNKPCVNYRNLCSFRNLKHDTIQETQEDFAFEKWNFYI